MTPPVFPGFVVRRALRAIPLAAAIGALLPAAASAQSRVYTPLGNASGFDRVPGGVLVRADHGGLLVESVAGVGARVRIRFGDATAAAFASPRSFATGDAPVPLGAATTREAGDTIVVSAAEGVEVRVTRHPVRVEVRDRAGHQLLRDSFGAASFNGQLVHYVADAPGTRYMGLGEQASGLLRNGQVFQFWNTDQFAYQPGQTIYSTVPFYLGVVGGVAHGVMYDNGFRGEMDFANRLPGSIGYTAEGGIDGGELRYYVIPGPGIDSTVARYARLTGRMPLPPKWALGYQQSRYSYYPDTQVANLGAEFRRRDIPLDVIHLDIHYMNGYRVFTWDPQRFPQPKRLLDSLAREGIKVITIVDPGVKVDPAFPLYRDILQRKAFVTLPDGSPALGKVWPDTAVYPDFTRADVRQWWGAQQAGLVDQGVRGIWNDMNEPASFLGKTLSELATFDADGRPGTHAEYHNQYGALMARASYEGLRTLRPDRRPFVITRDAYPGVQKYSSVWTGDNRSTWEHLHLSIPMVMSLNISGVPFAGSDIGGFVGAPGPDMYARWLQAASLFPFFRTHAAIETPRREPWSFGAEYERANRATIRLRYALIPNLYTAFDQHARTGAPVVRPISWGAPADTVALGTDDEYMVGDHLLVAPVLDSATDARDVWFPAGRWYRIGDTTSFAGGARSRVQAPAAAHDGGDTTGLRGFPLFARAGSVIPMQAVMSFTDQRMLDTLSLHVFPGAATSQLYEDAGDGYAYEQGQFRRTTFTTTDAGGRLGVALSRTGAFAGARTFTVTVHLAARPRSVTADSRTVAVRYDAARQAATFDVPSGVSRIEVTR